MISSTRIGAAIIATIGRRGQKPDMYDARIVGPITTQVVNGRTQMVAPIIFEATNLAGEKYLAERVHNLAFAFDRDLGSRRNPALDGTPEQPKTWQQLVKDRTEAALAFLAGLPESDQVQDVDSLFAHESVVDVENLPA